MALAYSRGITSAAARTLQMSRRRAQTHPAVGSPCVRLQPLEDLDRACRGPRAAKARHEERDVLQGELLPLEISGAPRAASGVRQAAVRMADKAWHT